MSAFKSSKPPNRPVRKTLRGARSRDLGLRSRLGADPQWYRQLFDANPLPMWVYDLQTLRFLAVNEVACAKYGYTRDEFLSMTIRDIRPPEDIGAVERSVQLTPTQVFTSGVWRHLLKDGTLIFVLITSREVRYDGRPARFVAPLDAQVIEPAEAAAVDGGGLRWFSTLQDVTAQKNIQSAIRGINARLERRVAERTAQLEATNQQLVRATQAAERANKAKSEFLSHMSHELRTPLNAIIGFSHLMATPGHGLDAQRQAVFNGHIHKAGEHLLTLISELLDLAQIEAGKLRLDLQLLPLQPLLSMCQGMVMPQAQSRGLRAHFDVPPDDLAVVADGTRLKQVLLNLLSNAIKYNRPGGVLEVRVLPAGREHVRVEVRDGGAGLSPGQVGQLFEAFNRLGRGPGGDDPVEGTGLGLVVTRHLVEQMGGRIGVDSEPGVGSCFWIELASGRLNADDATDAALRVPSRPHGADGG